jgi:molybdenum cofactor synthesis domain-containing protein
MLGDVMCATLHNNTAVRKGRVVAATRAIPLVVSDDVVETAAAIAREALDGLISVHEMRRPRAGVVITGTEIFNGRVKDSFAGIIAEKIRAYGGEVIRTVYAPDDEDIIECRLKELMDDGADLLITTGGMSVDPDDVTRFAIKRLGADGLVYGSAALPGAMLLVAYIGDVPILGVPACGVHHKTTVFDLVLPRVLAGEKVGREELAELGHGGLCLSCEVCRYPVCPFGK